MVLMDSRDDYHKKATILRMKKTKNLKIGLIVCMALCTLLTTNNQSTLPPKALPPISFKHRLFKMKMKTQQIRTNHQKKIPTIMSKKQHATLRQTNVTLPTQNHWFIPTFLVHYKRYAKKKDYATSFTGIQASRDLQLSQIKTSGVLCATAYNFSRTDLDYGAKTIKALINSSSNRINGFK